MVAEANHTPPILSDTELNGTLYNGPQTFLGRENSMGLNDYYLPHSHRWFIGRLRVVDETKVVD